MQISNINQNPFGRWCVIGKDSDNYKRALKPYKKQLDKITEGFDVSIEDYDEPVYAFDGFLEDSVSLHGIPLVTIKPYNNANRLIPMTKLYVYPGAGEVQCESGMAEEMIDVIKKGISLYV